MHSPTAISQKVISQVSSNCPKENQSGMILCSLIPKVNLIRFVTGKDLTKCSAKEATSKILIEEANSTDDGSAFITACISSQPIEQIIEDVKVVYRKKYKSFEDKLTKQLGHAKAIETGEYNKGPILQYKTHASRQYH